MFFDKFSSLCEEKGVSVARALTDMGMSKSAYKRWKTPDGVPGGESLRKMAGYFNVSVGSLLGEEEEKPLVNGDEELTEYLQAVRDDPDLRLLFSVTKGATKKDIQDAIQIIQMLKSRDRGDTL